MLLSRSSMPRFMLLALLVILLITTWMVVPAVAEDSPSNSAPISDSAISSSSASGDDSQSSSMDSSASPIPSDSGATNSSLETGSQDQTSIPNSDADTNAGNQGETGNLTNGTPDQISNTPDVSTNDSLLGGINDSNPTDNPGDQTTLPASDVSLPDNNQTEDSNLNNNTQDQSTPPTPDANNTDPGPNENQDSTSVSSSDDQSNIPSSNNTNGTPNSILDGSLSCPTDENPTSNQEETTVVVIPQSDAVMGDPFGFVYDAVTEGVVSGVALEVYLIEGETSTLVTDTTPKNVYTGDGTGGSVEGKYSFILSKDGTYQIKYSKTGYVDYLSTAQLFNTTDIYDLGSLYLVPLVTDADGSDISLKHDLITNGQDITIINAKDILLNTNITIDTRSVNSEGKYTGAGSVNFSATQDITENAGINVSISSKDLTLNATRNLTLNGTMNIDTREYNSSGVMTGNAGTITSVVYGTVTISDDVTSPGADVDFTAPTITLGNNVVIDTRQVDGSGELTGYSGALDFNSSGTITIGSGSGFYSGGFDASAADFTFNGAATISSSVYNNEGNFTAGLAGLTASNDLTLTQNLSTLGGNLTLTGTNITVNDNVVIDTRQMDDEDVTTAKSGNLLFNAEESINVKTGAKLLAGVSQGSTYDPGTITLTASNQGLVGYSFIDVDNDGDVVSCLFVEPTTATITVSGTLEAGDIVIRANAGQIEELTDLGEDDQPAIDCALAKLTEYLSEIIPLPVAIKVRDNQAYININSGATISSTGNLTLESNAISEAEAQAIFYALAIGYCEADATADTEIKGGANLSAAGDVLIKSYASTSAEMKAWTINFKNPVGSLVLGITNNNLTSKAVVAQNANITGRNINIQALGDNSNQASASATAVSNGTLVATLGLEFSECEVVAEVNGNLTATGQAVTDSGDIEDGIIGGIGILAELNSEDQSSSESGVGGSGPAGRLWSRASSGASAAKDKIMGALKKGYVKKAQTSATTNKNNSGSSTNLEVAMACAASDVDNDVTAKIGSTAVLKSGLDLDVKSILTEEQQIDADASADPKPEGESGGTNPDFAASGAVVIGLYDNTATTTVAGTTDAKRNTVVTANVIYPWLMEPLLEDANGDPIDWTPETFAEGFSESYDLITDFLGLTDEMINSWCRSTSSAEKAGIAGTVTYFDFDNTATATIDGTARINQNTDYQTAEQSVAVDSDIDFNRLNIAGIFTFNLSADGLKQIAIQRGLPMPGDSNKLVSVYGRECNGVGGTAFIIELTNDASSTVKSGARIHAGTSGKLDVTSNNKVRNVDFCQSGGQADDWGVAGTFSWNDQTSNTTAAIERGAIITAGALNVTASDKTDHLNILGGVIKSDGVGIGASVGVNSISRNVTAGITEADGAAEGNTNNIVITGDAKISADADGSILVAAVAAALPDKKKTNGTLTDTTDTMPDQSSDTSNITSDAPESGSTGSNADSTKKSQGKFGIGVSGAVSINEITDNVKASLDYSDNFKANKLTVSSTNKTNILTLTGSAAMTKSTSQNSGTLAGAYSQITLNGTTETKIDGVKLDLTGLLLSAIREGNLWSISASGANSSGQNGIAIAGSVSVNTIKDNTNALMNDVSGTVDGDTSVDSQDKSSMHVIAGAVSWGGRGGFGASVAYNNLQNNTTAQIQNSTWMQKGKLALSAANSTRAGPIDVTFDLDGNPVGNVEIMAVAGSLGVSPKGNFGGAGTVAINRINNTAEASIYNSTCTATGSQDVSLTSIDDSNIFSIAGSIGVAKNVGLGAAVSYNEITNYVNSYIDSSTLTNIGSLTFDSQSGGTIKTIAFGVAGAQDVALAGSASVNLITNDVKSYANNSTVSAVNSISFTSTGSAGIGSVAGGFAASSKAAIGAAVAYNTIGSAGTPNQIRSYIINSKITSSNGSLALQSTSNSVIKSLAVGGAGSGKFALGGSVTINTIFNNIEASIKECNSGETKLVKAKNDITLDAADNSVVSVIAGSAAGAGTASVAAAVATVQIGTSGTHSKTQAYIENAKVTSESGNIALRATSNAAIFNIAAGAAVGGTAGITGSASVNQVYSDVAAKATNSTVNANGNISVLAVTLKRTSIPKGATQTASDDTLISSYDGNTSDTDDSGQGTAHTVVAIQSLAGSVAGGGDAGIGAAVSTNQIRYTITSNLTGSTVTSTNGNVRMYAVSAAGIESISAALAASGTFSAAAAVSTNQINNVITTSIVNSTVTSNNASNTASDVTDAALVIPTSVTGDAINQVIPGITLIAADTSTIGSIAGQINISGTAGIGAAAAYNEIGNQVKAEISTNSILNTTGSVLALARSSSTINTISAGGSFSVYVGVAGTVAVNTITNVTDASVISSTVSAADNVYLLADSDGTIHSYGGAVGGAIVGIGAAAVVNTIENTTRAYASHGTITASGTGSAIPVRTWNGSGDDTSESLKGLFIIADSNEDLEVYSAAASGGAVGISGQVSVNYIKDTTEAYIAASNVNASTDFGQWVKVKAAQNTDVDVYAGALTIGGAAAGAVVDKTNVENTTRAFISNTDGSTGYTVSTPVIYARGVEVLARSKETVSPTVAGASISSSFSAAGAVSNVDIDSQTTAYINIATVYSLGDVKIDAIDKAIIDSKVGALSAGIVGAGGSVAVNFINNTTLATIIGSSVNATGLIEIKAEADDSIITKVATGAIGASVALAGAVTVNDIENTTGASLANYGSTVNLINQDARFKSGGTYAPTSTQTLLIRANDYSSINNISGSGSGGLAAIGAAIDIASIKNRVVSEVDQGTKIYARGNVNLEAEAHKTVNSTVVSMSGGLVGISGAVVVINLGGPVSSDGSKEFTSSLKDQVNGDISLSDDELALDDSNTIAQNARTRISGITGASINEVLNSLADTGDKMTAAYVNNAGSAANRTEIVTGGTLTISASNTNTIGALAGQAAIGAAAIGASVIYASSEDTTRAFLGDYSYVRAGTVTIQASGNEKVDADSYAANGGLLFAVGANVAYVDVTPTISSNIGNNVDLAANGSISVLASVTPEVTADVYGVSVGWVSAGGSVAMCNLTPNVRSFIGSGSRIAGAQLLTGDPTLIFTSNNTMTGNPTLNFVAGDMSAYNNLILSGSDNSITRTDSLTWASAGFYVGEEIIICGSTANNDGGYIVTGISGSKLYVEKTFSMAEDSTNGVHNLSAETVSEPAKFFIKQPDRIIRNDGKAWTADGFIEDQSITVTGSANNDGMYEVAELNGNVMILSIAEELVDENNAANVKIEEDLPNSITRSSGSWTTDGFVAGQSITISGSGSNDGTYAIDSISRDGRIIYLDSSLVSETSGGLVVSLKGSISNLTVKAEQRLPSSGNSMDVYTLGGAGGYLVGINATYSSAVENTTIQAVIGTNTVLQVAGEVQICTDSNTKQTVDAQSYSAAGLLSVGACIANASSNVTNTASVSNGATIRANKLTVAAIGSDNNYAEVTAGSGGIISGAAAVGTTNGQATTTASIGNSVTIGSGSLTIRADHTALGNGKADSMNASLVGASGASIKNTVNSTVETGIGGTGVINSGVIDIIAINEITKNWLNGGENSSDYNVKSGSGGAVDVPAAKSETIITAKTHINVGEGAQINVIGDPFDPKALRLSAFNDITAKDKVKMDSGGIVSVPKGESKIYVNADEATVTIGKGSSLTSIGEINLCTRSDVDVKAWANVKTYGGAGYAMGTSIASVTGAKHLVTICGPNTSLFAHGSINLLAGRDDSDYNNYYSVLANTDLWNKTAIPISTDPQADAVLNQTNIVNVQSGVTIRTVKDTNLLVSNDTPTVTGTGIGKDLYRELAAEIGSAVSNIFGGGDVCLDIKGGTSTKTNTRLVNVDGTIEVGIHNQQWIDIDEDGNVTCSEGVTYTKGYTSLRNDVVAELKRIEALIVAYNGTDMADLYKADRERLIQELVAIGNEIYSQGGATSAETSTVARVITVNDIWAQSANINVLSDSFTGTGSLTARANASITINNASPYFLTVKRLTIPEDSGGYVTLNDTRVGSTTAINNINLIKGQASFGTLNCATGSPVTPSITVRNAYLSNPTDIYLTGSISNVKGTLSVYSLRSIISSAESIHAATMEIKAEKDIVQGYVDGFLHTGALAPNDFWDELSDALQSIGWDASVGSFTLTTSKATWEAKGLASQYEILEDLLADLAASNVGVTPQWISGGRMTLSGRYLNLNGIVQSGYESRSFNLQQSAVQTQINSYLASHPGAQTVQIYIGNEYVGDYNVRTRQIIIKPITVEPGYIEIFGRIMSTSPGSKLVALNGYTDITINNNTNYDLVINKISSTKVSGKIKITDLAYQELVSGGQKVVKEYTSTGTKTTTGSGTSAVITYSGVEASYQPVQGLRYIWSTGQDKNQHESWLYKKSSWLGFLNLGSSSDLQDHNVRAVGDPILLPEGETVKVDTTNKDVAIIYNYERKILSTNVVEDRWTKKTWWGKKTYYLKRDTDTGFKVVNTYNVKADYPITIQFIGSSTPEVNITSAKGIILNGSIYNPDGVTNLTANGGAIERKAESAVIYGKGINLTSTAGLGNLAALIINLTADSTLNASASVSGDINIEALNTDVKVGSINAAKGNVNLTADQSIIAASADSMIKGRSINLTSLYGGIGSDAQPLVIDSGTESSNTVTLTAQQSMVVRENAGNLRLVSAESKGGDVTLYIISGDLIDANTAEVEDTRAIEVLQSMWTSMDLTGTGALNAYKKYKLSEYNGYWRYRNGQADNTVFDPDYKVTLSADQRDYYLNTLNWTEAAIAELEDTMTEEYHYLQTQYGFDANGNVTTTFDGTWTYESWQQTQYDRYWYYKAQQPNTSGTVALTASQRADYVAKGWSNAKIQALETVMTEDYHQLYSLYGKDDSGSDIAAKDPDWDVNASLNKQAEESGAVWTENQLMFAISPALFLKRTSDTQTVIEEPNIKGRNIKVITSGSLGNNSGVSTIDLSGGAVSLTEGQKVALAAAEPQDIIFYDANYNVLLDCKDSSLKYLAIVRNDDIDIDATGSINIQAGSKVLVGSQGDINLENVTAGSEIRLKGEGIYTIATPGTTVITGADLILEAASGSIGTATAPILVSLSDAAGFTGRTKNNIYVTAKAGTGRLGHLNIRQIYADTGSVYLITDGSIYDYNNDEGLTAMAARADIEAAYLEMTSGGTIGSGTNFLDLSLGRRNDALVKALANGSIYLAEVYGTMNVKGITSTNGDVSLVSAAAILDGNDDGINGRPSVDVSGLNIILVAKLGGIGLPADYLDINTRAPGVIAVDSFDTMRIIEVSDDLQVALLTSHTGKIYVVAPGDITSAGGNNLSGEGAQFRAGGSFGSTANPINSTISYLEGVSGSGGVWIINTGGVTVGGVDTLTGIDSDGIISITAHSPIVFAEDTTGLSIIADAADTGAEVDNITVNSGIKLTATAGPITFNAADNIYVNDSASLDAAGSINMTAVKEIVIINADLTAGDAYTMQSGLSTSMTDSSGLAAGQITINAAGGDLTILRSTVETSGGSMSGEASGNVILTNAIIRALLGNVTFHGINIPITDSSQIYANNTMTADAAAEVTVDNSSIDAGDIVLTSGNGDLEFIKSLVTADRTLQGTATDDILIDADSSISANDLMTLKGDYNNADVGTGCTIEIYGELVGQDIRIYGESDVDCFILQGATISGPALIFGADGNDLFTITRMTSTLDSAGQEYTTILDGQEGSDTYTVQYGGMGDYTVKVRDTGIVGTDLLTLNGTANDDSLLMRWNFVAMMHGTLGSFAADVERIGYDSNIETLDIYTFAGSDHFYMDDNSALTTIHSGSGDDTFQIGQIFGSKRDAAAGVASGDEFATITTTRGELSTGTSYIATLWGGDDNDIFMVYSNHADLLLKGENGNDRFLVRAFALADPTDPHRPKTSIDGGTGEDYIEYNVNSLVDIDGGEGYDTINIIGSEFADVFVITDHGIVGAGLNVVGTETECFEAYGMEGDDIFYIQSTNPYVVTKVFGGQGSDSFYILGDVTKHISTSGTYNATVVHDLSAIAGPLLIEGGISESGTDAVLVYGVTLPEEQNPIPEVDIQQVNESQMTDAMYVYNDDSSRDDVGVLTYNNLSGMGLREASLTLNEGTTQVPLYTTYQGGITYVDLEIIEVLLGTGQDKFTIDGSAPGTIAAIHGGGGDDTITVKGQGNGLVVVYGDTSGNGRYNNKVTTNASVFGHYFSNPGNDSLFADESWDPVVFDGGPGNDNILGSGCGDWLAGGAGDDTIRGQNGDDFIFGDSAFEVNLVCRDIREINNTTVGRDMMNGGYGNDIIIGDHGVIYTKLNNRLLTGNATYAASVGGVGLGDVIFGDQGQDMLIGGPGEDQIDGGDSEDIIYGDNISVNTLDRPEVLITGPVQGIFAPAQVEEVVIIAYRWKKEWSGLTSVVVVPMDKQGDKWSDVVNISTVKSFTPANAWWRNFYITTWVMDQWGSSDYIAGGSGDDWIFGQKGDDTLLGDSALFDRHVSAYRNPDGTLRVSPAQAAETDGSDYIEGGAGSDQVFGGLGSDALVGGNSTMFYLKLLGLVFPLELPDEQDYLFGGSGYVEIVLEGIEADKNLEDGDDLILGDNANLYVPVAYAAGQDEGVPEWVLELLGYEAKDKNPALHRTIDDYIFGEGGNDFIHGMSGCDFVYGGDGNDSLIGGGGKDTITTGRGTDQLIQNDDQVHEVLWV